MSNDITPADDPARVTTVICRLSYPHLERPQEAQTEGGKAKYSCELIFDKVEDLAVLQAAAKHVKDEQFPKGAPKNLRSPFRKGDVDREGKDGYEGKFFIGARTVDPPGIIIGKKKEKLTSWSQIYGGCYVVAAVKAFYYDHQGNKGIGFALNHLWVVRDGAPFGGRLSSEEEFAEVEIDPDAFGFDGDDMAAGDEVDPITGDPVSTVASDLDEADIPF